MPAPPRCGIPPAVRTAVGPITAASSEALVAAIQRELGISPPAGIRVGPAPPHSRSRRFLDVTLPAGSRRAAFESWAGLVTAVVYRDQAARNGLVPVGGEGEWGGTSQPVVDAVLPGLDRPSRSYRALGRAALRCAVRRNAARLGVTLTSVRIPMLEGIPVPIVVARVPAALAHRSGGSFGLAGALFPDGVSPLGWFAELEDSRGGWMQSAGLAPAAGRGVGRVPTAYRGAQACGHPSEIPCESHA